jgi:SPP1 family predicted phage head-tail adaptor
VTAPGDLNRRIVLEAPVESNDGAGGVTRSYGIVTTLWAQVVPLSGGPDVAAGSFGSTLRYRITIRMRSDITVRHQLREGARIYRIRTLRQSADRRFLEIDTEARQD